METWNTFTSNDALYTILGALGLASVIIVLFTATKKVGNREVVLRAAREQKRLELEKQLAETMEQNGLKGNLEPEENVL